MHLLARSVRCPNLVGTCDYCDFVAGAGNLEVERLHYESGKGCFGCAETAVVADFAWGIA